MKDSKRLNCIRNTGFMKVSNGVLVKVLLLFTALIYFSFSSNDLSLQTDHHTMGDGEKIYKNYCTICHGLNGKLNINGATDLSISDMKIKERISLISDGKGLMTPFKGLLSDKEIKAVAKYTMSLSD